MRWMLVLLVFGFFLVSAGMYLIFFTDTVTHHGTKGISLIVVLISMGLVFLIPAKVYIILKLMKVDSRKSSNNKKI